jgi:HD-GYP domain-containing protein (c-di-GMP phosphodiesterase class II)
MSDMSDQAKPLKSVQVEGAILSFRAHQWEAPKSGDLPEFAVRAVSELLAELAIHDVETYQHCLRVGHLCAYLAQQMSLTPYQVLISHYSGVLHDIGKQEVPFEVLHKPGRLTPEEYKRVQEHSLVSAQMIEPLTTHDFFRVVHTGVLYHHERLDGRGYPLGIVNVPLISRIILVADTYDAMKNTRSYRKGLCEDRIFEELTEHSGTQFDSEITKTFIESFKYYRPECFNSTTSLLNLQEKLKKAG